MSGQKSGEGSISLIAIRLSVQAISHYPAHTVHGTRVLIYNV